MAKKKTVTKRQVAAPVPQVVTIWNQNKIRSFQLAPSDVIGGGLVSDDKKFVSLTPNSRIQVRKELGEQMAKNYPEEIILV